MRCVLCGRALNAPTKSITTKDGVLQFGPVCAKRVFPQPTRTARPVLGVKPRPAAEVDPRQLDLLEAIA
jgi:hypothetical protein